jgi:N-acetyl-anhydromuramyl-L-alanine amidase AmpD
VEDIMSTGFYLLDHPNPHGILNPDGRYHGYMQRRAAITLIVMHVPVVAQDVVGNDPTAENVARFFASTDRSASAHVNIDRDSTVDLLPDTHVAFHVRDYNSPSLGVECGWGHLDWGKHPAADREVIERVAAWCAPRVVKYGIPLKRLTKRQVDAGAAGFTDHSRLDPTRRKDPGPGFPWDTLFARIGALTSEDPMAFLPIVYGDGTAKDDPKRADVAWLQRRLNRLLPDTEKISTDGVFGDATATAIVKVLALPGTGTSDQRGHFVGGNQWGAIEERWAATLGTPGPRGLAGPPGPEGPQGRPGAKGKDAPVPTSFVPVYD